MDPNDAMKVNFTSVVWPNASWPNTLCRKVRTAFLVGSDGILFDYNDLKDILKSWLHDELGACPIDFDFSIVLENDTIAN